MLGNLILDLLFIQLISLITLYTDSDASEVSCASYIYVEGFPVAHKNCED